MDRASMNEERERDVEGEVEEKEGREHINTTDFRTAVPVFDLTDVPESYWSELNGCAAEQSINFLEIRSSSTSPVTSVEEAYELHMARYSPADDSAAIEPFTYFTFLVIDAECVASDPPTIIVCCDSPDYGESVDDPPLLKQMRLPLDSAVWFLAPLEQLCVTCKETEDPQPDQMVLSSVPPSTQDTVWDSQGASQTKNTFAESRIAKQRAIQRRPGSTPFEKSLDDERETVIFYCPLKEAKNVADLHRQAEDLAKGLGYKICGRSNLSKKTTDPGIGSSKGRSQVYASP